MTKSKITAAALAALTLAGSLAITSGMLGLILTGAPASASALRPAH